MYNTVWQVCDSEVFPVSIFDVDSVELQQIDSQENDEIEPLQGRSATERYTTYRIYQERSTCNYIGQLPCRILYCLHFASIAITITMVKLKYRDLIWNSDYYEAYLSNMIFL